MEIYNLKSDGIFDGCNSLIICPDISRWKAKYNIKIDNILKNLIEKIEDKENEVSESFLSSDNINNSDANERNENKNDDDNTNNNNNKDITINFINFHKGDEEYSDYYGQFYD